MQKIKYSENVEFLIKSANKYKVAVKVIDADLPLIEVTRDGKSRLIVKGQLPFNSFQSVRIVRDKDFTKKIISRKDIKVPVGILAKSWDQILKAVNAKTLSLPLVAKPNTKALGRDVVANISGMEELETACRDLLTKYGEVLVENCFDGDDNRLLVLDGEVLAVAKRLRPYIIGNGKDTIQTLVTVLNEARIKKIPFDLELDRNLSKKNLDLDSIPGWGEKINLRANSNFHTGAIVVDATDIVASEYREIAVRAAEAVGIRLAGVDIMTKDIAVFSDYIVTEINSVPGFDVHLDPSEGKPRLEILGKIWDALFA